MTTAQPKKKVGAKVRKLLLCSVVVGSLAGIGVAVASPDPVPEAPPTPPWVTEDGELDPALLPEVVPLLDCNGGVFAERSDWFSNDSPAWVPPPSRLADVASPEASCDEATVLSITP
jgi:hypothetical protein